MSVIYADWGVETKTCYVARDPYGDIMMTWPESASRKEVSSEITAIHFPFGSSVKKETIEVDSETGSLL